MIECTKEFLAFLDWKTFEFFCVSMHRPLPNLCKKHRIASPYKFRINVAENIRNSKSAIRKLIFIAKGLQNAEL